VLAAPAACRTVGRAHACRICQLAAPPRHVCCSSLQPRTVVRASCLSACCLLSTLGGRAKMSGRKRCGTVGGDKIEFCWCRCGWASHS
jgi:hypothetical protein